MRDLGVKRVHYSSGDDDEMITENVKDMFSIQFNYPVNDSDYYKYILERSAPKIIKRTSLAHFIRFNLEDLLPSCNYSFYCKKGVNYIRIEDGKGFLILIRIM